MTVLGWDPPPAPALPPQPPARRSAVVVAAVVVGALVVVGVVVAVGVALARYGSADHLDVLDDPVVVEAADSACVRMAAAVREAAPPAGAPVGAVASAMRDQDAAVTAMVGEVRAVGAERLRGDRPAISWLADWETLVRLREAYADAVAAGGHPALVVPVVDGVPITDRMGDAGPASCDVVEDLAQPPTSVS